MKTAKERRVARTREGDRHTSSTSFQMYICNGTTGAMDHLGAVSVMKTPRFFYMISATNCSKLTNTIAPIQGVKVLNKSRLGGYIDIYLKEGGYRVSFFLPSTLSHLLSVCHYLFFPVIFHEGGQGCIVHCGTLR